MIEASRLLQSFNFCLARWLVHWLLEEKLRRVVESFNFNRATHSQRLMALLALCAERSPY